MSFVDIAGLVAGASEGAGLGNKFLANIRECDAICQVVRVFSDDDVAHVAGQVLDGGTTLFAAGLDTAPLRELNLLTTKPFLYVL